MRKLDRFLISKRPYAVDPATFRLGYRPEDEWTGRDLWNPSMRAVWYRRRRGETVACFGTLFVGGTMERAPRDYADWLEQFTDGRYGGSARARWDGAHWWDDGSIALEEQGEILPVLRSMLEDYPSMPPGYDGWWTFQA